MINNKIDTFDKIYCRFCGKEFSVITRKHLNLHDITKEEYKSKGYPIASDHYREKIINFNKTWRSLEGKSEQEIILINERKSRRNEKHKLTLRQLPEEIKKSREVDRISKFKENWKNKSLEEKADCNKKVSIGVSKYINNLPSDIRKERIDNLEKGKIIRNEDPERYKEFCNQRKQRWSKMTPSQKLDHYIKTTNGYKREKLEYKGFELKINSSYESIFAKFLIDNNINFEFESLAIKYEDGIVNRTYIPDFYIPSINLIIEVKPFNFLENDEVKLKKEASIKLGYDYIFITEVELIDLPLWKAKYLDNKIQANQQPSLVKDNNKT